MPNAETLLFSDGKRRIDMILVYEEEEYGVMTEAEMMRRERRKSFQQNLEREGLEFELVERKVRMVNSDTKLCSSDNRILIKFQKFCRLSDNGLRNMNRTAAILDFFCWHEL